MRSGEIQGEISGKSYSQNQGINYDEVFALFARLKELQTPQKKPMKFYVDNSLVIALTKDLVFHDRSKYIDT
jgi:hypothetical protein